MFLLESFLSSSRDAINIAVLYNTVGKSYALVHDVVVASATLMSFSKSMSLRKIRFMITYRSFGRHNTFASRHKFQLI